MAIVLTCHLIETIWSKKDANMRAPFIVIDHNGQQHQTEVMKAGAVTVWNTKATFPYAPSSDLVVMAFDAAGRQPGAFIAQAVVDVAAMLQDGSLNASAALVNRKGQSVGVVLFDVGLVTSSRALAAGLDIPSLTFSSQPCPDSPTAKLKGPSSPTPGAPSGRSSPFAQLAVQHRLTHQGSELQPGTPGSAQSMGHKLVGTISQALVGALLGLETRDRDEIKHQSSRSLQHSSSPKRLGAAARSLDCVPTGRAGRLLAAEANRAALQRASGPPTSPNSSLLSRRSMLQQATSDAVELPPSPPSAMARCSSSAAASAPPAAAGAVERWAADRASFSAWRPAGSNSSPLTAGRPLALSAAGAPPPPAAALPPRMAASANGNLANSRPQGGAAAAAAAALQPAVASSSREGRSTELCRPSRLILTHDPAASESTTSPQSGSRTNLSPLTEARSRLRLGRQQPLPPLSQLFPQPPRDDLIPVGRAPISPGGCSQATAGFSQGPEGSADYDALLREFDAADAAGKEAILFRELLVQQQERQAGSNQLLSLLTQQQQQEVLEHQQLMDALESMNTTSPVSSPAQAAGDAFRSCFTSSTQITSSSGRTGSSGGSSTGSPFKHYPSLPDLSTAEPQAGGFSAMQKQQQLQQERGTVAARAAAAAAAGGGQCGSRLAAAGAGPQQLNAADESDGEPLYSTRQGGHKLQRAAQQAAAAQAEAAEAAAEARQLNWQMLQRLRQKEAAAAVPVASYPISHNGTEISDNASEVDAAQDSLDSSPSPKAARTAPIPPAYTCSKAPGQLGGYNAAATANSDQTEVKKRRSRWVAPVKDVVPYPKPLPVFPAVAMAVQPSAPLMTVPEEHSSYY